ncbi:MAG: LptE family protein [Candidatus Omnitrophica bacterium]|nr:LptE family protein [Candidatus Omnitrophota bacterium]
MKKIFLLSTLYFLLSTFVMGCGYVTHSTLPPGLKVAVPMLKNSTYHTGVEIKITRALIKKFTTEGTAVTNIENADFLLSAELINYDKEPLRWVHGIEKEVEEYRLTLTANVTYKDLRNNEIIWEERINGDTDYFIVGSKKKDEENALEEAVKDLAENIINRICEEW